MGNIGRVIPAIPGDAETALEALGLIAEPVPTGT